MALKLPRIFLLSTHLEPGELHALEDQVGSALTYDVHEAEVVLGKISRRERAMFELRRIKLETEPLDQLAGELSEASSPKRRKMSKEKGIGVGVGEGRSCTTPTLQLGDSTVKVVKLSWLRDSLDGKQVLPMDEYLLYEGRRVVSITKTKPPPSTTDILERATGDHSQHATSSMDASVKTRWNHDAQSLSQRPTLFRQSTSEHDLLPLPPMPSFLETTYSCQRPTPVNSPNAPFAEALKGIRTIRLLHGGQVGVRAYSTSIATIAAYPYLLQKVARLPGCGTKIAELWHQWKATGQLKEAVEAESDPMLLVLQLFYDIWGVGDTISREFYRRGWRDLDDLVEYGWGSLSRVQQIGVKYFDEFKLKIPRKEVESIGAIILSYARNIDPGFQLVIVGGYRRGKDLCGDVDVILSHPEEVMTMHVIEKIVMLLEKARLITHTLSLSTRNSEREQAPLPWNGEHGKSTGFDTLDKALVVWQDPKGKRAPHRRVDIIVSPWKTVGCAVLGWSGGTTFQRDLRRYCKNEKGFKFDSSGIRSRADGMWIDLEGTSAGNRAPDMESAERRVFAGLGLPYRRPEERCTG